MGKGKKLKNNDPEILESFQSENRPTETDIKTPLEMLQNKIIDSLELIANIENIDLYNCPLNSFTFLLSQAFRENIKDFPNLNFRIGAQISPPAYIIYIIYINI